MHDLNFLRALPHATPPQHHPAPHPAPQHPPRRRRVLWRRRVLVGALALWGAVWIAGAIALALGGARTVVAARALDAAILRGDLPAAQHELQTMRSGLGLVQTGMRTMIALDVAPFIGDDIHAARTAVNAAVHGVDAVDGVLGAVTDVLATATDVGMVTRDLDGLSSVRPFGELSPDARADLVRALHRAAPDLATARARLLLAQHDLAQLASEDLHPALARLLAPLQRRLPEMLQTLDIVLPFARVADVWGGVGQERQFLVLFLNSAELRPGGGFIAFSGLLTVRDGSVVAFTAQDSYAVDAAVEHDPAYQQQPPTPLTRYLGLSRWFFRDAAWFGDFPRTAAASVDLFAAESAWGGGTAPRIDGVIALTPQFAQRLLALTGPVQIGETRFDAQHAVDLLQEETQIGYARRGDTPETRKDLLGAVAQATLARVLALPPARWTEIFTLARDAFARKTLAVWSPDSAVQAAFADAQWSGALHTRDTDDILGVLDANMGSLKSDPAVARAIAYHIVPHEGGLRATATITYTHHGVFDYKTTRYRTYLQIVAPRGAQLVSTTGTLAGDLLQNPSRAPGTVDVREEDGMTVFGAFTSVEPGATQTVVVTYDLPPAVVAKIPQGAYTLRVLKQMGAGESALTLDLDLGRKLIAAAPAEDPAEFGDSRYRFSTVLDEDREFRLRW